MKGIELNPKRYFFTSTLTACGLIACVCAVGIWGVFFDELFGFQILNNYQIKKTQTLQNIDTVFVGDSSLGNALDAQHFSSLSGKDSVNLALTGLYGYAYRLFKPS